MADSDKNAWRQLLLAVQHHHALAWRDYSSNRASPYDPDRQFEAARQDTLEIIAKAATKARIFVFREAILWGDLTQKEIAEATGLSPCRVSQILKSP